jgi:YVTN family beta-propeller protein
MPVVTARLWRFPWLWCAGSRRGQSHAKDTGLIFVSNEKTNNLIVLDPKTYQVVKDIKVSRRPRDSTFQCRS